MSASEDETFIRLTEERFRAARASLERTLADLYIGPPRPWVGRWRRWVEIPARSFWRWLRG